jgi:hypothetical protein
MGNNLRSITRDETAGKAEQSAIAQAVRNVGQKTFYKRNNQWVDSTASEKQENEPQKVARFSSEYFDLVDKNGRDVAKYLAMDEPVLVVIDGKSYLVQ